MDDPGSLIEVQIRLEGVIVRPVDIFPANSPHIRWRPRAES